MMYDDIREHPEEGLIHAWLDDALAEDDASRMSEHVAACPQCTALVAEARGLIAGASRVVTELDEVPVSPVHVVGSDLPRSSAWRSLRLTPARLSAAAVLIVALGVGMTQRQMSQSGTSPLDSIAVRNAPVQRPIEAAPQEVAAQPQSDAQVREQVAKRVAAEQPARVLERLDSPPIPSPVAGAPAPAAGNTASSDQVAAARMSIAAQRDTTSARSDHARVGQARSAEAPTADAARAADARFRKANDLRLESVVTTATSSEGSVCYRVESVNGEGTWGDAKLPFVIAMDSAGVMGRVLTLQGKDTEARTVVTRSDTDSLAFRLRRIGFTGSMALGGAGAEKKGFARSTGASVMEQVTTVRAQKTACPKAP